MMGVHPQRVFVLVSSIASNGATNVMSDTFSNYVNNFGIITILHVDRSSVHR